MKYKTGDVFGVKSKLIASYVERLEVDSKFQEAITEGNEIIVYGSSKQGKTSLILRHLKEDQYVKVECSPQTQTIDIYKSILRQLNITFIESETTENTIEHGGKITGSFKVKVPLFLDTNIGGDIADKHINKESTKENYIEYNLSLAQDVSE
ncbi:hypothetical protein, partial [Acinetobacter oleivorans]|uniref:hypothetical protein n=1 Tax=Acinetobacter oleivorans TaxID=1148157 RepID=UPI001D186343